MSHPQDYDDDLAFHTNRLRRIYESELSSVNSVYMDEMLERIHLPLLTELRQHDTILTVPSFVLSCLKRESFNGDSLYELLVEAFDWELIDTIYKDRRTPFSQLPLEDLFTYLNDGTTVLSRERGFNVYTRIKVRKHLEKKFKLETKAHWFTRPLLLERFSQVGIVEAKQYFVEYCKVHTPKAMKVENVNQIVRRIPHVPQWDQDYDQALMEVKLCLRRATIPDVEALIMFSFRCASEWNKGTSIECASNFVVSSRLERDLPYTEFDWNDDRQYMMGATDIRFIVRTSAGFQEIGGGQMSPTDDVYIVVENIDPELKVRITKDFPYSKFCPKHKTLYGLKIEKILGRGALSHAANSVPGLDERKYTIYRLLMETFPQGALKRLLWVTAYTVDIHLSTRPFLLGGGLKYVGDFEYSDLVSPVEKGRTKDNMFYFVMTSGGYKLWDFYQVIKDLLKHQLRVEVLSRGEQNQVNAWLRMRDALVAGQPAPRPPVGFVEDCGTLVKINSCLLFSKKYYESLRDEAASIRAYMNRNSRKVQWRVVPDALYNDAFKVVTRPKVESYDIKEVILSDVVDIKRRKKKVSKHERRGRKKKRKNSNSSSGSGSNDGADGDVEAKRRKNE